MHTNSAAATIDRIVNAFPADEQPQVRGMLAESLVGIVAQQLLRSADGKGRVAAHEILLGSPALASMIREDKTFQIPSMMQSGQAQGMQTMDMALERYVRDGTIAAGDRAREGDRQGKLREALQAKRNGAAVKSVHVKRARASERTLRVVRN